MLLLRKLGRHVTMGYATAVSTMKNECYSMGAACPISASPTRESYCIHVTLVPGACMRWGATASYLLGAGQSEVATPQSAHAAEIAASLRLRVTQHRELAMHTRPRRKEPAGCQIHLSVM